MDTKFCHLAIYLVIDSGIITQIVKLVTWGVLLHLKKYASNNSKNVYSDHCLDSKIFFTRVNSSVTVFINTLEIQELGRDVKSIVLKSPNDQTITMYFIGRETLFFTNNGMSDQHGIFTQLFFYFRP